VLSPRWFKLLTFPMKGPQRSAAQNKFPRSLQGGVVTAAMQGSTEAGGALIS